MVIKTATENCFALDSSLLLWEQDRVMVQCCRETGGVLHVQKEGWRSGRGEGWGLGGDVTEGAMLRMEWGEINALPGSVAGAGVPRMPLVMGPSRLGHE